ncbi:MAG: hypothetical protein GXO50_09955 [Chlorobi bacterium]|nr:hypothetical protein [Chlorobiota bacterium]
MEKDFKKLWNEYSDNINPENLDAEKFKNILSSRFKHETAVLRLRSFYDFILILFVPAFLFFTLAQGASTNTVISAGSILLISVGLYLFYQIRYHKLTRSVNLADNTIKSLYEKISEIQEFIKKYTYFYHPPVYLAFVTSAGILLFDKIKDLPANDRLEKIILFAIIAVGAYIWNGFKRKKFTDLTLDAMKKELMSLNEI